MFSLFRFTRKVALLVIVLVLAAVSACFVNAGNMLVEPGATDMPEPADAIVVLSGTPADRWLEGYDLWRAKRAPLLVLSPGTVKDAAIVELERRGVAWRTDYDAAISVLTGPLGMPKESVVLLSQHVDNTADEAIVLRKDALARAWTRVIVVTSLGHTRRTALALDRVLTPAGIDYTVRGTRYDRFHPSRWWRSRNSARWVLVEWPKLLMYRMGLRE